MNNIEQLKRGDLVVFTYSGGYCYPMIFHSISRDKKGNTLACRGIILSSNYRLNQVKDGSMDINKIYKDRVQGDFKRRVWKITEDCLTEEELKNYNDWKKLLGL